MHKRVGAALKVDEYRSQGKVVKASRYNKENVDSGSLDDFLKRLEAMGYTRTKSMPAMTDAVSGSCTDIRDLLTSFHQLSGFSFEIDQTILSEVSLHGRVLDRAALIDHFP